MEKNTDLYEQIKINEDRKIGNALEAYKVGTYTKQECVDAIEKSVLKILDAIDDMYGGKNVMVDIRV
jgi:hypothetical protein